MKAAEFLSVIKGLDDLECENWREMAQELCGGYRSLTDFAEKLAEAGYVIESVDGYGGEGKGDEYWGVFSVTHNEETTYFKLNGWYASYEGGTIDDPEGFCEVEKVPVQTYEWKEKVVEEGKKD